MCIPPRVSADVGESDKTAAAVGEPDKRGSYLIMGALGGSSSTLRDQLHPPSHCQQTKHSVEKEKPWNLTDRITILIRQQSKP